MRGLDMVTINLWGDNGPAAERMHDLGSWLAAERPDVVLMQEVEHVDGVGQAELLARAGGYDHLDVVRTGRPLPGEGLAVASRHPVVALPMVRLPLGGADHPRGLQQVEVVTPHGTVRTANTHLAWRLGATKSRVKQVGAIAAALRMVTGPVVLGGDLNDVPGSDPLLGLTRAGFTDCCAQVDRPAITFDAANSFLWQPELAGRRIDHVAVRGGDLVDARVVLDGIDGPIVSDHYGVRATVGW